MANLKQNRSGLFYYEGALTANYKDNSFNLDGQMTNLKISATGAAAQFSIIGGGAGGASDIDGTVAVGETLDFFGLELGKLALRGAGSTVRAWAY